MIHRCTDPKAMCPRSSNGSPRFRSRVIASSIPPAPHKYPGYCVIIVPAQPEGSPFEEWP